MYSRNILEKFVGTLEAEGLLDEGVIMSFRQRIGSLSFDDDDLISSELADSVFAGHPETLDRLGQEWIEYVGPEDFGAMAS